MKPMNFPSRRRKRHLEAVIRNTSFRINTADPKDRKSVKEMVDQRQAAIDAMDQLSQYLDIRTKKKRN